MEFKHISIMLDQVIEGLNIQPNGIYVDGTLGGAGHSSEICKHLDGGRLIGIDQDRDAIAAAKKRLEPFPFVTIVKSNYVNMDTILNDLDVPEVNGIFLDLGVSSYQFDNGERGFSYRVDAPLDMRMDQDNPMTAKDVVNTYTEQDLYRIIRDYGEDPFANRIARRIVQEREKKAIETTFELNEIIKEAIPAAARRKGGHPSKKTYQALRIEINHELSVLENSIDGMIDRLADGGRLCIITFHSLEDRIVKAAFRKAENPCICPPEFPVCVCGNKSKGKVITRKPIEASPEELEYNPRSSSAKLRIFERKKED